MIIGTGNICRTKERAQVTNLLPNFTDGSPSLLKLEYLESSRYQCQVCGKPFGKNSHLTRHLLSHSGEKPFVCFVCGKKFSRKDNCRDHCRLVHNATM